MLGFRPLRDQWTAFALLLAGYWAAFAFYTVPADFDYAAVGVATDWPHLMTGFQAHWNKNGNLAWAFDTWFLNLFPRAKPFEFNGGGYATLSFIPTLGTMILGLIAGGVIRSERPVTAKVKWLMMGGIIGLASGALLGALVKLKQPKRALRPIKRSCRRLFQNRARVPLDRAGSGDGKAAGLRSQLPRPKSLRCPQANLFEVRPDLRARVNPAVSLR